MIVLKDQIQNKLIALLQLAYSGELAAAQAYNGHYKSLKDSKQKDKIREIELEELAHREQVGVLLRQLGAKPNEYREIIMNFIGKALGKLCFVSGWFLPMYFACKLEEKNIAEYKLASKYAAELGLDEFVLELEEMAKVEQEHYLYFKELIASHPLSNFFKTREF